MKNPQRETPAYLFSEEEVKRTSDSIPSRKIIPIGSHLNTNKNIDDLEQEWLKSKTVPVTPQTSKEHTVLDLFAGCGGMSLGIEEALRAHNIQTKHIAVEMEAEPLEVYKNNFPRSGNIFEHASVLDFIQGTVEDPLTKAEQAFKDRIPKVDILVGGPPCQGHSDLNNHTRRLDPKNELFFTMARCAEIFNPEIVIIENVPGARHDKTKVVQRTKEALKQLGYSFDEHVFHCNKIGVAQKRKRFIIVATKQKMSHSLKQIETSFSVVKERPLSWAIEDLEQSHDDTRKDIFNSTPNQSKDTVFRIGKLFEKKENLKIGYNERHNLDNKYRPPCHRDKKHSYNSVYGRMFWDKPTQTITGNFGTQGGGRYVHSTQKRLITPHEAARIQFFPDFFDFTGESFPLSTSKDDWQCCSSKIGLCPHDGYFGFNSFSVNDW